MIGHSGFMMELQVGEHILSLLGRYCVLSHHKTVQSAVNSITNDRKSLCPTSLQRQAYHDIFCLINEENTEKILIENTLYNYYRSFIPSEAHFSYLLSAKKPLWPVANNTLRHTRTWRWCCDCARSDFETYGMPFFRIEHQLPGIVLCPHHNKFLSSACNHCGMEWKSISQLPIPPINNQCPNCNSKISPIEEEICDDILWFHEISWKLLDGNIILPNHVKLREKYRDLIGVNVISAPFRFQENVILGKFKEQIRDNLSGTVLKWILKNLQYNRLGRLAPTLSITEIAYHPDKFIQPIFHLMIIRALWGDISAITE